MKYLPSKVVELELVLDSEQVFMGTVSGSRNRNVFDAEVEEYGIQTADAG